MKKDFKPEISFDLQLFAEDMNQSQPAEVDEPVEDDLVDEPVDEPTGDDLVDEPTEEPVENTFSLDIKYNGEEQVIDDIERARELAQKGMNYDKINERATQFEEELKQYKDNPLYDWANDQMQKYGYDDPKEFLKAVNINQKTQEYQKQGLSPQEAKERAEMQYRLEHLESQVQEKQEQEQLKKEQQEFLEWHDEKVKAGIFDGELDPNSIPESVWQEVDNGTPLKVAYMEYALEDMAKNGEQKVLKKIKENKQTSTGSTQDNTQPNNDPKFTPEYIEKMVEKHGDKWIDENFDKIEESGYFKMF